MKTKILLMVMLGFFAGTSYAATSDATPGAASSADQILTDLSSTPAPVSGTISSGGSRSGISTAVQEVIDHYHSQASANQQGSSAAGSTTK